MTQILVDHAPLFIVHHVKLHVDFSSTNFFWGLLDNELGQSPPFRPMRALTYLHCHGEGPSALCVKWPLTYLSVPCDDWATLGSSNIRMCCVVFNRHLRAGLALPVGGFPWSCCLGEVCMPRPWPSPSLSCLFVPNRNLQPMYYRCRPFALGHGRLEVTQEGVRSFLQGMQPGSRFCAPEAAE